MGEKKKGSSARGHSHRRSHDKWVPGGGCHPGTRKMPHNGVSSGEKMNRKQVQAGRQAGAEDCLVVGWAVWWAGWQVGKSGRLGRPLSPAGCSYLPDNGNPRVRCVTGRSGLIPGTPTLQYRVNEPRARTLTQQKGVGLGKGRQDSIRVRKEKGCNVRPPCFLYLRHLLILLLTTSHKSPFFQH